MVLDGVGWSWMVLDGVGWSWMMVDGLVGATLAVALPKLDKVGSDLIPLETLVLNRFSFPKITTASKLLCFEAVIVHSVKQSYLAKLRSLITVRRFWALPAADLLSAIGCVSPKPCAVIRLLSMPLLAK